MRLNRRTAFDTVVYLKNLQTVCTVDLVDHQLIPKIEARPYNLEGNFGSGRPDDIA